MEFTRRTLLALLGAGGLAATAGCQIDTGTGGAVSTEELVFPDMPGDIPASDQPYRWVDSGDLKSTFIGAVIKAFGVKHPDVKTQYDPQGWDSIEKVVPLGIRNKSAHDVFALPQTVTINTAIDEGWVRPLDDIMDVPALVKQLPEGSFIEGAHTFEGKTYSWPVSSPRTLPRMSFYDVEIMKQAGYDDPGAQITTWEELRAALKAVVTKTGKAGMMTSNDALAQITQVFAWSLGWTALPNLRDPKTGEMALGSDEFMAGYEFLSSLATDKLIVPGYLSMAEKEARTQFSSSVAGVLFNGPWDLVAWRVTAPDWQFSIGLVPSQDGQPYHQPYLQRGANGAYVYSESKLTAVTAQIVSYMLSPEGQKNVSLLSRGLLVPMNPEAEQAVRDSDKIDPNAKVTTDLSQRVMRIAPDPDIRNPDNAKVTLVRKAPKPAIKDLFQGLFSGQLSDPRKTFAEHMSREEKALDEALATAKQRFGSTMTREQYAFDNYDPTKDYTAADYQALS